MESRMEMLLAYFNLKKYNLFNLYIKLKSKPEQ